MMENECADARNEPIEAKLIAACADGGRVNVTPEKWKRVRSLLDSYANALVAAAVEACKEACILNKDSCGESHTDCHDSDANCMSFITPESAAKELERIKNAARIEILKYAKQAINGCLELGYGNEKSKISRYDAIDAIAALEAAKEK